MSFEEIEGKVAVAKWFSLVGGFPGAPGFIPIRNLVAWSGDTFSEDVDSYHADIAMHMDWLPTTRDQEDPFHAKALRIGLQQAEPEAKARVLSIYKKVMSSLRAIDRTKLSSGHNDFSEAATGAAAYCSRMAAMEVAIGRPAIWCNLLELYCLGFWPCGRLPNGDIVVY